MTNIITVWCCYDDPEKKRCKKVVRKSDETVRCLRQGVIYCKKRKAWFCEKHYQTISIKSKNNYEVDKSLKDQFDWTMI
jgi:hypothetical protein